MADYSLIETLGWNRSEGFVRLARHLSRLQNSSLELGFSFDRGKVLSSLENAVRDHVNSSLRIRIELNRTGDVAIQSFPYQAIAIHKSFKLAVAQTRMSSSNNLARHKTTQRSVYESARAEYPADKIDEVILLNERGEVCEGTITNIFLQRPNSLTLLTPTLACGLLPGILRQEYLETGKAEEAVLNARDLDAPQKIFVGNSLRGLIPAHLGVKPG